MIAKSYQNVIELVTRFDVFKELSAGRVSALIYDSETNFDATVAIYDKGMFPICGISGLRPFLKSVLGFPAVTLAFTQETLSEANKFYPLVKILLNTGNFSKLKRSPPIKDAEKLNQEPKNKRLKLDIPDKVNEKKGEFGDDFIKFS